MGFTGVYKILQEIFPQIDDRLLRAVAIENPKDPDEAAATIINEIVPLWSERSKPPVSSLSKSITEDGTHLPGDQMWNKEVGFKSYSMSQFVASVNDIDRLNYSAVYNDDSDDQELPSLDIGEDSYLLAGSSKMFHGESSRLMNEAGETVHQEKIDVDVGYDSLISDLISMGSCQPAEHNQKYAVNINLVPDEATEDPNINNFRNAPDQPLWHGHKDDFDVNLMPGEQQNFDASTAEEHDLFTLKNVQEYDRSALDVNSLVLPQVDEGFLPNSEKQLVLEKGSDFIMSVNGTSSSKHDFSGKGRIDLESDSETDLVSQSSKVIKIDQLEEMINEAKTNKMCQSLEARLAAAEEMRTQAEKEIQIKEEIEQKALAKQESIMETVVQESNRLHQEAEENAKLRDFLIDRGHLVDMLQGEISVICQDVEILKEKFDANLPLSKSFTSAQTTCASASSSSSVRSVASDLIRVQNFLSEILKRSPSSSINNLSPESKLEMEEAKTDFLSPEVRPITSMNGYSPGCRLEPETVHNDCKYLEDDGLGSWEIFDKDTELAR